MEIQVSRDIVQTKEQEETAHADIMSKRQTAFFKFFLLNSWKVLFVASCLQIFFFHNEANVFAVFCVLLNWTILTQYILKPVNFNYYPLSTFLILGFSLTQFYFPLIFTLIEGNQVVNNLLVPFDVFTHLILEFLVLIASYSLYKALLGNPGLRKRSILRRFGMFSPRTEKQVWIIGFIGLFATIFTRLLGGDGVLSKFIVGFVPFMYAPFLIPLSVLFGVRYVKSKTLTIQIAIYTVAVFILGIIGNSRGSLIFGFTALGFSYFLGMFMGVTPFKIFTSRNIIIAAAAFWFVTGPLSDLSIAMVVVRAQRTEISASELINQTWLTFQDKNRLKEYKLETSKAQSTDKWDESYVDNIFLSRFCNLKYNDNALHDASELSDENRVIYRDLQIDMLLSTLPTPFLTAFNIKVDKKSVNANSLGDVLFSLTGGDEGSLGSFRTSSFSGTATAAFGWWYLALFGIGMAPVFFLFDKLFIRVRVPAILPAQSARFESHISLCALMIITSIFQFLPVQGVLDIFSYIARGWIQTVLLYFVVYRIARLF